MLDLNGKTGLVTGASAGIGREIARLLAKDLGTIVLVARRKERLEELGAELKGAHPKLRVEVRAVDLVDRVETGRMIGDLERHDLSPDVLINNAGFGDYGLFEERAWARQEEMLELNVVSATFLLHRVLPKMIARGFGAVLNVGSSAGMLPGIGMSTYAASKAYFNHLSEAVSAELAGTGVSVTVVCPGPVPTEFQDVANTAGRPPMPKAFQIDAKQCAEEAIDALVHGRTRVIPGARMRAAVVSLESVPRVLLRPFLRRQGERIRSR
jgi:short-subunit dehydrogenase